MKFCSEANSENTDSKAALLANTLTPLKKYPKGIVSTKSQCLFICIFDILLLSLSIDT